ncbi:MAG: hypothetical protein P0S96_05545 [Simkaniaceae bacterium]|nr:hypothetical protein [Candidatus Sacchlamyda saccharinae]
MKKVLVLFACWMITGNLFPSDCSYTIPQSKVDSTVLSHYTPYIKEELKDELALQDDERTHRFTREYGYSFFKMAQGDFSFTPPPEFLQEIGALVCEALGHEPVEFTNIILSNYDEDFSLEPHVDINEEDNSKDFDFYFDERVYGIIIEPDLSGHLYFVKWEEGLVPPLNLEPIYSLSEEAGTVFCLQDELRKFPFFHGVSKVSNHRISITFRTVQEMGSSTLQ